MTGDNQLLYRPPASTGNQWALDTDLSFSYRITDGQGHTDDALVRLLIEPAPAPIPPVATDDRAGPVRGNRSLIVDVLANDSDLDGPVGDLRLSSTDPAVTVVDKQLRVAVGGRSSQYRYMITDRDGLSATATLTVFVVDNEAPSVSNLVGRTAFETPIELSLPRQVDDPDGDELFFVCCDHARGGVAEIMRSGPGTLDVRFTPSPGFTGQAGFSYLVDDRVGHTVSGYVGVVVAAPTNRPPSTRPGDVTIDAGTDLPFDLSSIVDDPDLGDSFSFSIDPLPSGSGLSAHLSGSTLLLSAAANATPGPRSADFQVTDRSGATATGSVKVTIEAVRAPLPQAVADSATTSQGTPVTVDVLVNDIDPLGGGLSIRRIGTAGAGVASIIGSAVAFSPNSDFFGTATLTYTVGDASQAVEREAVGQLSVHVIGRPDPPSAPSAVAGNSNITLAWTTPQANGAPIDRYRIEVSTAATTTATEVSAANSQVLDGLTNGQDHRVRLTAHNSAGWGESGPWSIAVRPDTGPDTPAAPQTSFGDGELLASWSPPTNAGSAITGYRLEIGGGANQIVSLGTANAYTWRGLSNGVEYRFRVAAVNDAGSSEWSPWSNSEHPFSAPLAPAAPTVTRGNRSLEVLWEAPANGGDPISGYDVELRSTGHTVRVNAGSTTGYRWADIANGVAQEFRVRAINRAPKVGQWSPWSAPIVPCDVPDAVTTVAVTRDDSQLAIAWSSPNDQGCGILSYNLRATGGATSKIQTAGAGSTTHLFTGLTNGTPYVIEIQAVNEEGGGSWSAASAAVIPAGPPGVASIGSASAVAVGQIQLAWSSVAGNGVAVTGYDISINGGAAISTPSTSHIASGLTENTTYSFRVRACNAVGCGAWSASVDATTWGPPSAPRAVNATAGNATWRLSWSTPAANGGSPVVSYQVRVNGGAAQPLSNTTFSFDLAGATNGTTYLGEVRACNAVGCGAWSNATATPSPPPPIVSISMGTTYVGSGCAGTCHRVQVNGSNFAAGSTVTLSCYDTRDGRFTGAPTTAAADGTISATPCFYGYGGETVWVTANGVESNRILWP